GESSKSSFRISTEAVTPRPYHSSRTTVDLDLFGLEKKFGAQRVATLPGAGRWVGHRLRAARNISTNQERREEAQHGQEKDHHHRRQCRSGGGDGAPVRRSRL